MDCTDKDIDAIINALLHSIQRVYSSNVIMRIYVRYKDSGGGGTELALLSIEIT